MINEKDGGFLYGLKKGISRPVDTIKDLVTGRDGDLETNKTVSKSPTVNASSSIPNTIISSIESLDNAGKKSLYDVLKLYKIKGIKP
jgi:hypothetical protein